MFMQLNLLWLLVLFSFYPHRSPDAVRGGVNHPVKQGKCRTLARDFLLLGTLDPTFNVNPCMPMGAYSMQRNCLQVICKTKGNLLRGLPQSTAVEGFLLCLAGAGSRRGLNCWTSAGMSWRGTVCRDARFDPGSCEVASAKCWVSGSLSRAAEVCWEP